MECQVKVLCLEILSVAPYEAILAGRNTVLLGVHLADAKLVLRLLDRNTVGRCTTARWKRRIRQDSSVSCNLCVIGEKVPKHCAQARWSVLPRRTVWRGRRWWGMCCSESPASFANGEHPEMKVCEKLAEGDARLAEICQFHAPTGGAGTEGVPQGCCGQMWMGFNEA